MPMHYVYVLESVGEPGRYYSGETEDLRRRFDQHNTGASKHTAKYRPWKLIWYAGFENTATAMRFERYLKTGSGRAFQKRFLGEV